MAIIGISGKIGSGKDLVGQIIQYLVWKDKVEKGLSTSIHYDFDDFESVTRGNTLSRFIIKKYADKLKDIVCLLIGCSRVDLENRVFKDKELGEEWWYYEGQVGVYPYNTPYEANKKLPLIKLTPRKLLQLLGTNCGRNIIHPNIWINSLFADYKPRGNMSISELDEYNYPNWIITDVRFPNEANIVKEKGGIIIRLTRKLEDNNHESETALDNYEFDYVINNDNGDIPELMDNVKRILMKEGIING